MDMQTVYMYLDAVSHNFIGAWTDKKNAKYVFFSSNRDIYFYCLVNIQVNSFFIIGIEKYCKIHQIKCFN